jgi:multiple sugar transport system ATP-binding protein
MVFQSYALYPHMTVAENISFGLRLKRVPKREIAEKVARAAAPLELSHLLDRKPRELSGGQRQRVAIGRALVQEPGVFLFDEPLSNLDAKLRISMRVEIGRLHRHLAATSVYVTHDQVEALTLADRIVVMNGGRIEQAGPPLDLYHRPVTTFVAGFIGSPSMNMFPGRITGFADGAATVRLDAGEAEVAVAADPNSGAASGDRVTVGIRPEHVRLSAGAGPLSGRVDFVERLGEVSYLHLALPGAAAPVVAKAEGTAPQREGETLGFAFAANEAHLFDAAGLRCADTGRAGD